MTANNHISHNGSHGYGRQSKQTIRFIDLFCGIGGFRLAAEQVARENGLEAECVFSSDIDVDCQIAYEANFGERPFGDITKVEASAVPDHDLLLAGFPCQPFSIIGQRKGFDDTRGTLFFDIARILEAKRPSAFILENVKMLVGHDGGKTLSRIMAVLKDLGYQAQFRVLNALDFGLPQKRERIFIVGFLGNANFDWPREKVVMTPLKNILEKKVPPEYFASEYIQKRRLEKRAQTLEPTIWHENKSGHISAYPFSCALRAGASYNYLLVNGERRLTMREMLRLQGFPDSYKIVCNYSQTRKQAGNSLPVTVASAVLRNLFLGMNWKTSNEVNSLQLAGQIQLLEKRAKYDSKTKTAKRGKIHATVSS